MPIGTNYIRSSDICFFLRAYIKIGNTDSDRQIVGTQQTLPHHQTVKDNEMSVPYTRGPQPPGHRLLPVRGLLGTGPHSRRWVAGDREKLHLLLPIARIMTWTTPPPSMEKLSSTKPVPWCQKVWGPLPYTTAPGLLSWEAKIGVKLRNTLQYLVTLISSRLRRLKNHKYWAYRTKQRTRTTWLEKWKREMAQKKLEIIKGKNSANIIIISKRRKQE